MPVQSPAKTSTALLRLRAARDGPRVAHRVLGGEQRAPSPVLTYAEWLSQAECVAAGLKRLGVGAGDRVVLAFCPDDVCDCAVTYLALHGLAAVPILLAPDASWDDLVAVVRDHRVVGIVVSSQHSVELSTHCQRTGLDVWLRDGNLIAETASAPKSLWTPKPDALAAILRTSGTTGVPKGVAVVHADLTADAQPLISAGGDLMHAYPLSAGDAHYLLLRPLTYGATVTTLIDPRRAAMLPTDRLATVTEILAVPYHLEILLATGALSQARMPALERIMLGSTSVPSQLLDQLARVVPTADITIDYSCTESGRAGTQARPGVSPAGSLGSPTPGTQVSVRDPRTGSPVDDGSIGEIWLRHTTVPTRSYDGDWATTHEVFVGGWVRTGDLGRRDADGNLWLVDRLKRIANVGGVSVSCAQVEQIVTAHPAVREAAAVRVPHPRLGEAIACGVVLRREIELDELERACRARLHRGLPIAFRALSQLPRTPNGKVHHDALRASLIDSVSLSARSDVPQGPLESVQLVLNALSEATGRAFTLDDDFGATPLSSFETAHLHALLSDRLGAAPTLEALFMIGTVRDLAAAITSLVYADPPA